MPDRRTSREIIWQHAADYGWQRWENINGNPAADAFHKRSRMTDSIPYPDAPELIVWYSRDGRSVIDASWNGGVMYRTRRDDVMDVLEGHR